MKRAYLFNTGCIRRALDATRVYQYLIENGWAFTNNISAANLVVISTCGAVERTEDLSLVALRNVAKKISDGTRLVVTGCLPKISPEKLREIHGLGSFDFVPTGALDQLDTLLDSQVLMKDVPDANMVTDDVGLMDYVLAYRLFRHSFFLRLYKRLSANRAFVKSIVTISNLSHWMRRKLRLPARARIIPYYNLRIAEGCAFACTYCCIRFATGRVKSKPIDDIEAEFKRGLAEGHEIFQLVCEDVGCYGIDIGTTFPTLLRRLLSHEGDYKLVMIDFGGYWLVRYYDEIRELFKQHPDKIRELYVALQSGSNDILKAMKRPEKIEDVKEKLLELKREIPGLTLRTTVIIGFPGETEEDFQKTKQALAEIDFAAVELNKYEDRPGTASSTMPDKVPQEVIDRRVRELHEICLVS